MLNQASLHLSKFRLFFYFYKRDWYSWVKNKQTTIFLISGNFFFSGLNWMCLLQVLSSLKPADYLVVACLPGISEVCFLIQGRCSSCVFQALHHLLWFHYYWETWALSWSVDLLHFIFHRNCSSAEDSSHCLGSTGPVPLLLGPFLDAFTLVAAGDTPLLPGELLLKKIFIKIYIYIYIYIMFTPSWII